MFGTYAATSFEVEAERRREVLAASMLDVRRSKGILDGENREAGRQTVSFDRRRAAGVTAIVGLLGRVLQRV